MKKSLKKNTFVLALISLFSIVSPIASNAIGGQIPQPVIGTAQGFYAGKTYAALFAAASPYWVLAPGELMNSVGINIYQVEVAGQNCITGTRIIAGSKLLNQSTNKVDANFLLNFTVPVEATNKAICAVASLTTTVGSFASAPTYATVAANPGGAVSAAPSVSATPTVVAEVMKPTGSKPSVSGTPIEGSKFKVSVKAWNMNGNDFEGRTIYLKLCGDSNCNDVINSYPVVESGTLKFDVAKTLTMPKVVGKAGQYVKVVDTVTYPALASGELSEDQLVELSSSIKKIQKAKPSSPSATPTATEEEAVEATPEVTMEEVVTPTPEATPVEVAATSSSLSIGIILGAIGALVIALLVVIIVLLSRKKK